MTTPVQIARIVASRGRRGEVVVDCSGSTPELLTDLDSVLVDEPGDVPRRRALARAWLHDGRLVLHFDDCTDIDSAKRLVGRGVYLLEEELPELPEGTYYTFRLVGARVIGTDRRPIGRVVDTETGVAQDLLIIETDTGRRAEVPMAQAIVRRVDPGAGEIEIDAPEGLLEGEPEVVEVEPRSRLKDGKGRQ